MNGEAPIRFSTSDNRRDKFTINSGGYIFVTDFLSETRFRMILINLLTFKFDLLSWYSVLNVPFIARYVSLLSVSV